MMVIIIIVIMVMIVLVKIMILHFLGVTILLVMLVMEKFASGDNNGESVGDDGVKKIIIHFTG